MEMKFYNYPVEKQISPFEPVDGGNYFVYVDGYHFSYLGDFEQIANIESEYDKRRFIFTGIYTLFLLKRAAVVKSGELVYKNQHFDDGHTIGEIFHLESAQYVITTSKMQEYKVDSWRTHRLETYSVKDDSGKYNATLQNKEFKTEQEAIEYAIPLSKQQDMTCVIAQVCGSLDLH